MIFRNSFFAQRHVTLSANKSGILFLLANFKIQDSAIVGRRRDVTAIGAPTRPDRNLQRFRIDRIECRHVVTAQAIQVRVLAAFMTKSARRSSPAPSCEDERIRNAHVSSQLWIEIDLQARLRQQELVANIAVLWLGRNSGICIVTGETNRVTVRDRFECAFLQPKIIAQSFRRLRHVFFTGITLWLISLVAHGATCGRFVLFLFLFLERHCHEPTAWISSRSRRVKADDVDVLIMRETYTEFRNELSSLFQRIVNVAEAGKQPAARVTRTVGDMAVRANRGRGSFTREELLPVAIQTGSVFGEISHISECFIALARFLPILRGNLVTRAARQLLRDNVGLMRELRVIDARCFWRGALFRRATLRWLVAGLCPRRDRHKLRRQKQQRRCERERNQAMIAELH